MVLYFAVIASNDSPLYETSLQIPDTQSTQQHKVDLNQFIIHASLDSIDFKFYTNNTMYLHQIDKFNDIIVSVFITYTNTRFVLLHNNTLISDGNDNHIKLFMLGIYELYTKYILSPFYIHNTIIQNQLFDQRVKQLAQRYLVIPIKHVANR